MRRATIAGRLPSFVTATSTSSPRRSTCSVSTTTAARSSTPPTSDGEVARPGHRDGLGDLPRRARRDGALAPRALPVPPLPDHRERRGDERSSPTPTGFVDDQDRLGYVRDHLAVIHELIDEGLPIDGYFAWSLMDNFEWAYGYTERFGLIRVDYDTLERTPKAEREVVRRRHPSPRVLGDAVEARRPRRTTSPMATKLTATKLGIWPRSSRHCSARGQSTSRSLTCSASVTSDVNPESQWLSRNSGASAGPRLASQLNDSTVGNVYGVSWVSSKPLTSHGASAPAVALLEHHDEALAGADHLAERRPRLARRPGRARTAAARPSRRRRRSAASRRGPR